MTARASMAYLITKLRVLVYDPAGASQRFSDDHIQEAADARRVDVHLQGLTPQESIAEGGVVTRVTYYGLGGWWEDDAVVQDNDYKVLTGATSPVAISATDLVVGRWDFSADLDPPVFLNGKQHDVYATAADLLEEWLAYDKEEFDFLSAGRTFKRSQSAEMIERAIRQYRKRQRVRTSEMVRTDMNLWAPSPVW